MKSGIKKIDSSCPLCSCADARNITQGRDHEYMTSTDDLFLVAQCINCGCIYLKLRPDESELSVIYPPDYYSYQLVEEYEQASIQKTCMFRLRESYYRKKLSKLLSLCRQTLTDEPIRIIDVGCGDGRLLDVAKKLEGDRVQTFGVEFNEKAVASAQSRGHTMYRGDIGNMQIDQRFHIILCSDVIEHVADPKGLVNKLYKLLIPGGILQIQTPNINSWDWKLFKHHWGGYHFPRHWVFFTEDSLRKVLQEIGLNVLETEFFPSATFWNWTFHDILTKFHLRSLGDLLFPPVKIFDNSYRSFFILFVFSIIDMLLKFVTGRTSNMNIYSRKCQ